jgi:hypothetical protein
MAAEARHHHYIPQGYLRGFAQNRSERQWYVHVADLEKKRGYCANTRNVCGQRDFMRVDIDGHPPDRVEKDLSGLESKCIEAIRRVSTSKKFEGEDASLIINLMALLAVRSPEMRENMRDFNERVMKQVVGITLSSKERWEAQMMQLRSAGKPVNDDLTYEDMKAFHEEGNYKVTVNREYQIGTEFQMVPTVLELLSKRMWTLYSVDGKHGEFVTTNRPVTLTFIDPSKVPGLMRGSPGFALKNTEIHFPLTRHAILVGRWDRGGPWDQGAHVEEGNQSFIGAVNTHMAQYSSGQVFSREKKIVYVDPLLKLRWDDLLVQRFTSEPSEEELANFKARLEEYERQNPSPA